MKSFLRKIIVIALSAFIVVALAQSGGDLLNVILVPLPKEFKNCISRKITNEVDAQTPAVCSGITHINPNIAGSIAVWDERTGNAGKIRESNIYEDYTNIRLGIGTSSPLERLQVDQGALSVNGGQTSTTGNILLNSDTANGPYLVGNTDSSGNATKTDAAMRVQVGSGFKVDSSSSTTAGSVRSFTNRMALDTTGNLTVGSAAIGDSRISLTGTNGDNDSILTMKQTLGPAFSILPWTNVIYLTAGVYYSNGGWIHSNVNSNNQLLRMNPGTGVEWFASHNSLPSWDQTAGAAKLLWNDAGNWKAPLEYGSVSANVIVQGESNTLLQQASSSTATGTHYYYNGSTSAGYIRGDSSGFGIYNSTGNNYALKVPIGANDAYVTGNIGVTGGNIYMGSSNSVALNVRGDGILRLNQRSDGASDYANGVYTPGAFKADGITTINDKIIINSALAAGPQAAVAANTYTNPAIRIYSTGGTTNGTQIYDMFTQGTANTRTDVFHLIRDTAGNYVWDFLCTTPGTGRCASNSTIESMKLNATSGLLVNGTASFTSDIRLKKDITPVTDSLEKLEQIQGVEFTWKENNTKSVGFIAQNVERVFPLLVTEGINGFKALAYDNMSAYIVEAIKELHAIVKQIVQRQEEQDKIIKQQQQRIEELEHRLGKLEKSRQI